MAKESEIKSRWEAIPVAENVFGRLHEDYSGDFDAFFTAFDTWLYANQGHILRALDMFDWRDKRVLEIGLGQGADSEQLIRRGAKWSGIDLTGESVARLRKRLELRKLPFDEVVQGSAVSMPFPDRRFDVVYSHGVLHHIPDIKKAQKEIRRVLTDNGRLIMMVYARNSLNYRLAIQIVRRFGLLLLCTLPIPVSGIYAEHRALAKKMGVLNYLKMSNFVHRSTDGPHNPYSKVYDKRSIEEDFSEFEVEKCFKLWMHAPPLPVHRLPGEGLMGWHLWAVLKPKGAR